jgi:transcriptional regulator
MYIPPHFAEHRDSELHRIISCNPLGILVTNGPHGLDSNHIPFEFDPSTGSRGTLRGHVARANPVWQEVATGAQVLVVFQGVDAYISPSWYPSKHETHRLVPTWNYEVVHAHGTLAIRDDEKYVRGVVGRLTRTHEAAEPVPWKMGDAPREYIDSMLRAIVGIEITLTRLVGKVKLSQNREARDRQAAGEILKSRGNDVIGQAMLDAVPPDQS